MCGKVHMFSFLFLTNLVHSLNPTVIFSWSTGERLNWSLTLKFTYKMRKFGWNDVGFFWFNQGSEFKFSIVLVTALKLLERVCHSLWSHKTRGISLRTARKWYMTYAKKMWDFDCQRFRFSTQARLRLSLHQSIQRLIDWLIN